MRNFNSLCFVHRHNVLFKTSAFTSVNHVPVRYSSLSAIHRGLRESEKSRPQGFARGALDSAKSTRAKRPPSRVRRDPDWTPTGFKLKKGKRDITDKGPRPKSRSERFNDPTESFGKKSLVYQVKHGNLREQLDALGGNAPKASSRDSFESKFAGKFGDDFAEAKSGRKDDFRRSSSTRPKAVDARLNYNNDRSGKPFPRKDAAPGGRSSGFARPGDRSAGRFGDSGSRRQDERAPRTFESRNSSSSRFGDSGSRRQDDRAPRAFESRTPSSGRFGDGGPRRQDDRGPRTFENRSPSFGDRRSDDAIPQRSASARDDLPIRIHYTTAASQFLYGRSVVEAALRASRRKLYHLYLYAGRDRQNLVQDATLEKLANQLDVPVTKILDNDGLRMMDKMSGGRPHNGCVLEASPTPQVPLKCLGQLSEDTSKPSFKVELAYQSAEDAAINGSPEEIQYHAKGNRKPFFLLLDGILDPGNLGAILRTAAFLGVTGVVISKHGSSGLTPVSLKASSGASEVLQLYSTASSLDFIERSKDNGWMIYASVAAGPRSRGNSHLTIDRIETYDPLSERPTILVIGSEGEGLEKKMKRLADFEVSIPGQTGLLSTIDSLNVSVATGIMCSAFLKKSQNFEIEEAADNIKEQEGESTLW
jgi:21S rRNA (GM2251-2'-O)-methyltransferase